MFHNKFIKVLSWRQLICSLFVVEYCILRNTLCLRVYSFRYIPTLYIICMLKKNLYFVYDLVPSSIQAIDDKTVTEGGSVTLSCYASGIPAPMVYWVKAGGQRVNGSVLMLPNITRNEAGEYRCEASNECGNATETANVDVQCKCLFFK